MRRVEYQNAHDLYWTQASNASFDASDLSLGFVNYMSQSLSTTGGRQKIELGEQRLIGSTEWLNEARSFDAARVDSGQWYAWGGRLGVANTKPETARMGAVTHADKAWGTTSLILKHDLGTASDIDIQTLDHFVKVKFGSTSVAAEGAAQYGSNNGKDQRAWAYHVAVTQDLIAKTTLSIETDAASGGGNSTTIRTFDNLYPSNHNLYDLADLAGWKNLNHLGARLENHSFNNLTLRASGHAFSLRDDSDAWYSATGTKILADPTGASGGDIGKELDLEALYTLNHVGIFSAGIAFFEPGNFVQNISGHSNQETFGYIQFQTRF
jgi:hypothetical protein